MPDNADVMKAIFTMLEQEVFYGDQLTSGDFVSLMSPGQFVSTELSGSNIEDLYTQWQITNDRLDTSFIRRPLVGGVSGLMKEILEFRSLPKKELSADQRRRLEVIARQLEKYTPAYDKYRRIWAEADKALRKELNKPEPDTDLVVELRESRAQAEVEWKDRKKGNKKEVEDLRAERDDMLKGNPTSFWAEEVEAPFRKFENQGIKGKFYETHFEPRVKDWDASAWTTYRLSYRSEHEYSYSRSTAWSAGFSVGWGLWHFGGSGGQSESYKHENSEATRVDLSFDVLRVRIQRPWLLDDLFNYRFWTWNKKTHGWLQISDGGNLTANPPVRPMGPRGMPFLQREMYVVRNLKIAANFSSKDETTIKKHIDGSSGFGWGPFSISGSYRKDTSERTYNGTFKDGEISAVQPQILAFGGVLLPRSPDPDRTLDWDKSEADFGDGRSPDDELLAVERRREAAMRELDRRKEVVRGEIASRAEAEYEAMRLEVEAEHSRLVSDMDAHAAGLRATSLRGIDADDAQRA